MVSINENFAKMANSYLFSEIARRVELYRKSNPKADIIRMGIGDVTLPLPKVCIEAMHKAVDEMGARSTFRGYGPERGYKFLIDKIREYDYAPLGVSIDADEIFIGDGAKSDIGNITDILGQIGRAHV